MNWIWDRMDWEMGNDRDCDSKMSALIELLEAERDWDYLRVI